MKKDVQNVKGKFWRSARLPGRGDAAALAVLALAGAGTAALAKRR